MLTASLAGLPVNAADCRTLLKPIDYLAFPGASTGQVEAIRFIEVKTGKQQAVQASTRDQKGCGSRGRLPTRCES